jgi:hypothetical protein
MEESWISSITKEASQLLEKLHAILKIASHFAICEALIRTLMRRPNYPIRNQDFLYEFTMKYTSKSCHLKMAGLKHERV